LRKGKEAKVKKKRKNRLPRPIKEKASDCLPWRVAKKEVVTAEQIG